MKWTRAVVSLLLAAAVFWALDHKHGLVPPPGRLLNPSSGFWQNGTRGDRPPVDILIPGLQAEVRVAWDSRRVPHIFAANDHDLYTAQGYIAASLRLWQMEFQVMYAAGRLSEIIGPAALELDRFQRRFGLSWAAENSLAEIRKDPVALAAIEAYARGVNAYIAGLDDKDLPLEYKILDYRPEPWTAFKSALLLKYMAYMLAGYYQEPSMTRLRDALGEPVADVLFPYQSDLVPPVVPPGTAWDFTPIPVPRPEDPSAGQEPGAPGTAHPGVSAGLPAPALRPARELGSNNWAVSGSRTRSGLPILSNDMHLGLTLPMIWYELQLAAPGVNVYGVSFPGAPAVVAGYNENIAWGFTNGGSDVLDWYAVKFKDGSRKEYLFGGEWRPTSVREERIRVRGGKTVLDRVVCTHHGPVVRSAGEPPFSEADVPADASLRWVAHEGSNEFRTLHLLDRGKNYADYLDALSTWACPAQNIIYADGEGTIAIWHNGRFPLRWKGQGRYILDGADPGHEWKGWVPRDHNPHVKNPVRGFVSSANQVPADAGYPYYLGWDYVSYERAARINEILSAARDITPEDMIRMQTDVLNIRARAVLPRLLELVGDSPSTDPERWALGEIRAWNFENRAGFAAPTVFGQFWDELNALTWDDERREPMDEAPRPVSQVMVELILRQPDSEFFDDRTTPGRETLADLAPRAFAAACRKLVEKRGPPGDAWKWGKAKGTRIEHLGRIPGLGRENLETDGSGTTINAISAKWAPSWRMVVELGPSVRAWGIYPGGQSGNPGSKFYDSFVDDWAAGRPYELIFLKSAGEAHPGITAGTTLRGGK